MVALINARSGIKNEAVTVNIVSAARSEYGTSHYSERITLEDIPSVETNLCETNESYALRLASRMFNRLVLQDVSDHGQRVERRIVS
jgi:hypothetical protein